MISWLSIELYHKKFCSYGSGKALHISFTKMPKEQLAAFFKIHHLLIDKNLLLLAIILHSICRQFMQKTHVQLLSGSLGKVIAGIHPWCSCAQIVFPWEIEEDTIMWNHFMQKAPANWLIHDWELLLMQLCIILSMQIEEDFTWDCFTQKRVNEWNYRYYFTFIRVKDFMQESFCTKSTQGDFSERCQAHLKHRVKNTMPRVPTCHSLQVCKC